MRTPEQLAAGLKRLFAQIAAEHPLQMVVDELGPVIERWVARAPDDPNALGALAWLDRLREEIRKADPRTYAGRTLPQSLTRFVRRLDNP